MSEKTADVGEVAEESGLTVVTVPAEHAQAVIDFVAGLETEETDVSGHMISRGAVGGMGALSAKMTTSTGCSQSVTGKLGYDMTCYDTDTIVTK